MIQLILRFTQALRLAICCILLTSCAVSKVWFAPTITPTAIIPEEHGYLAVAIVDASITPLPYNHVTLVSKELNASEENKSVRLTAISDAPNHSTIFFSSLPAGEYTLSNLRGYYSLSDRWYSRWASTDKPIGTFTVKRGQVTDLGRIILYPKVTGDRYVNLLVPIPNSRALSHVPEANILPSMNLEDTLTWDEDGNESERQTLYANIVQNPVTYNHRYQSEAGNLYLVGKLGFIFKRDSAGNWTNDAVESDFDMSSVFETESGTLIVGGEYGKVFLKGADGAWREDSLPNPLHVDAIKADEKGNLFVLAHDREIGKIFVKPLSDTTQKWSVHATLDPSLGWKTKDGNTTPIKKTKSNQRTFTRSILSLNLIEFSGQTFVASHLQSGSNPPLISPSNRYLHEVSSGFEVFTPKSDFHDGVDTVIRAGEGYLGINKPNFFRSWTNYYSFNSATGSWEKMSTSVNLCQAPAKEDGHCKNNLLSSSEFGFVGVPVFLSEKQVYAIVTLHRGNVEGIDSKYVAIDSEDGGKTWSYNKKPLPGNECIDTIPELTEAILIYCHGTSADFYQSDDIGKTWQHVRQSVKF